MRWIYIALLAVMFVIPSVAEADDDAEAARVALARDLFNQASKAREEGDWQRARELLEKAHELAPKRLLVLYNLANAQRQTGQLVKSAESYRLFIRRAKKKFRKFRKFSEKQLTELAEITPRLRIKVSGLLDGDEVRIDDVVVPSAVVGEDLPLDPGKHELSIERDGESLITRAFELPAKKGAVEISVDVPAPPPPEPKPKVDLTVPPPATAEPVVTAPIVPDRRDDDSGGVLSSPWFWTAVISVAGAAGASYYYFVYRPEQLGDPTASTLPGGPVIVD